MSTQTNINTIIDEHLPAETPEQRTRVMYKLARAINTDEANNIITSQRYHKIVQFFEQCAEQMKGEKSGIIRNIRA